MTNYTAGKTKSIERREFLQYAGGGVLAGGLGLLSAGCTQPSTQSQSGLRGNRKDLSNFPTLSTKERDRRWNLVREMMAKNDVECLLVVPGSEADCYFTNDTPGAVVIFPIEGEPTAIFPNGVTWAGAWLMAAERGEAMWISDWRFHPESVVKVLKEKGFASKRIGTLNMTESGSYAGPTISHAMWTSLNENLPNAKWVNLMKDFAPIWVTKSQEELALMRHGAKICEAACEVAVEIARPGVNELEFYIEVQHEILRHGAVCDGYIMHSGPENIGHYRPKWLHRAQVRKTIQRGDVIHIEMDVAVGAAHTQAQQAIAVGEVHELDHKAAALARESYEICVKTMRPGITFGDLVEAMAAPNKREGAWQLTPLIHSMSPLCMVDLPSKGIVNMTGLSERFKDFYEGHSRGLDIVLQPGMVFQPEPNAVFGRHYVDVGGNVVVTENGSEEWNVMPTKMRVVG